MDQRIDRVSLNPVAKAYPASLTGSVRVSSSSISPTISSSRSSKALPYLEPTVLSHPLFRRRQYRLTPAVSLRAFRFALLALHVLLVTAPVGAAEQSFKAPQQAGSLVLDIPSEWVVTTIERERTPSTTTIETGAGVVTFTILWNANNDAKFNSIEQLRESLEAGAESFLASAVESSLELESLTGPEVIGFFYSLSRREFADVLELAPGQYRDYTPGIFAVGNYQVFFTMTSREKSSPDRLRALKMFRQARYRGSAQRDGPTPEPPSDSK